MPDQPRSTRLGGPSTQRTRFQPVRFNAIWSSVISRLTPPSHPSTTSESALDSSLTHTDGYYAGSAFGDPAQTNNHPLQLLNPTVHPSRLKRLPSRRKAPKSSGANSTSRYGDDDQEGGAYEPVSHLVVDANFEHFTPPPPKSDSGTGPTGHGLPDESIPRDSTGYGKEEADEDGLVGGGGGGGGGGRSEVSRLDTARTMFQRTPGYEMLVERVWPVVRHFFDSSFPEPAKERSYQKENWFNQKAGAMLSSAYMLIAWALTVGLMPLPLTKFNWWAYFGLAGILMFPIPALVVFDFPRRHHRIWQLWLLGATWCLSDILVGEMYACGFFTKDHNTCGTRNFLNFFGFAYGFPTLAILALKQNRIAAAFGASQWLVLVGVLLVHQGHAPRLFYRNLVSFALFHSFLIGTSFLKERSDRQMFALRQQLKIQYRATQSAQVMERRASDSKKRFVSYIFHEVRVPLNTALLAVQNLEGENVFKDVRGDQAEMVHGLMGSLTMMEKVLNDVLSFNRMESGKFAQARKPFDFHKSIQLVALSHRVQAQMAGIELIVDLDKDIDKIGGMFVGDEMRLRQVASNLVSNSIKFTDSGSVRIVTKLLYPRLEPTPATEIDDPLRQAAINLQNAQRMEEASRMERLATVGSVATAVDMEKGSVALESRRMSKDSTYTAPREKSEGEEKKPIHKAVVRVEIHDTGVGLRASDVIDNRLFSPYVQTEIGRRQGGKGSGLGLALVRQIVKLSNGRLGVESQFGKGSMFWFELPYSLPPPPKNRSGSLTVPTFSLGGGGGGGGGGGSKTPVLPSVPGFGTPRLGIIEEASTPVERPTMVTTESTVPLLGAGVNKRRSSDLVNESVITATFPPVEGSSPSESPGSDIVQPLEPRDPFRYDTMGRRSSEASTSKVELEHKEKFVPVATRPPPPVPDTEPPLCTLVVDDDKLTRMLMSRMLTRLGHQVSTAENGKIALEMIRDSFNDKPGTPKFDIVFLDNQMPLMTGVEVAREVREMECPLFIVGCTGNALREDQDEYIAAGADEIIPKPIHQKSVEEMIRQARRRVKGETAPKERDTGY